MKKPNTIQKISVIFAFLCYVATLGSAGAVVYFYHSLGGGSHPAVAAWSAAIVFFLGAGIVLHVMGKADIPNFRLK